MPQAESTLTTTVFVNESSAVPSTMFNYLSSVLQATIFSMPQAESTFTITVFFSFVEQIEHFLLDLLVVFSRLTLLNETWQVQVILRGAILLQQAYFTRICVSIEQLVFDVFHNWHAQVVGGRAQVLILFASENIKGNDVSLGMTVLSSLRG